MKESTILSGILNGKCPKCREGKMFPEKTLYTTKFMKMNDHCSACNQSFMPEPGYYFGAMFISYAINAAFFIAIWIVMNFFMEDISLTSMIIALLAVVFGLLPVTFRLSRVLWIYIFVKYEDRDRVSKRAQH